MPNGSLIVSNATSSLNVLGAKSSAKLEWQTPIYVLRAFAGDALVHLALRAQGVQAVFCFLQGFGKVSCIKMLTASGKKIGSLQT